VAATGVEGSFGVTCREFLEWLDSGKPESGTKGARVHAESCATCLEELEAAAALELELSRVAASTAPDFVATVMARVANSPQTRLAPAPLPSRDWLPWWVRAAAQPATVLAFAVVAVVLWQAGTLISVTGRTVTWLGEQGAMAVTQVGTFFAPEYRVAAWAGVIMGFAPVIGLLLFGLYRGSQALILSLSGTPLALAHR
jgi:hypothetical protein